MTNEQIRELFDNAYDLYRQDMISLLYYLSLHKEEYEKSDFYEQTQLSIFDTYLLYHNTSLTYKNLLNYVQDVLNNVDLSIFNENMSIDSLFAQIPENYASIIQDVLKNMKL
jgi:hypothetical protein